MCGFRGPARDPGCAAAEGGPAEAGLAGPPAPGPRPARLPLSGRWPDGKGLSRSAASTTAHPAAHALPASSLLETQAGPGAGTLHAWTGHASTGA